MADAILRLPGVLHAAGFKRSTLYRLIAAGRFPRPVALGPRAVGWRESDITAWIESLATKPGPVA
jgi:prophage regulatory protein